MSDAPYDPYRIDIDADTFKPGRTRVAIVKGGLDDPLTGMTRVIWHRYTRSKCRLHRLIRRAQRRRDHLNRKIDEANRAVAWGQHLAARATTKPHERPHTTPPPKDTP